MLKSGKNRYYQTICDQFHLNCSGMCNLYYCIRDSGEMNYRFKITSEVTYRGCLCDNWKPSFLPLLILDWCTFWRRVTARWWRQSAKSQVSTNQNSRNRWRFIVRRTICICVNLRQRFPSWSEKIYSRKNKVSVGSFLLNRLSV